LRQRNLSTIPGRHWIGKKGGGNTEPAPKNGFGAIPYFLEITNVGEAYLIFVKTGVLPKALSTNRLNKLKTLKVFAKHLSVLPYACQLLSHLYILLCK